MNLLWGGVCRTAGRLDIHLYLWFPLWFFTSVIMLRTRGALLSLMQLMVTFGILLVYPVGCNSSWQVHTYCVYWDKTVLMPLWNDVSNYNFIHCLFLFSCAFNLDRYAVNRVSLRLFIDSYWKLSTGSSNTISLFIHY
jgi:hypothetical protein